MCYINVSTDSSFAARRMVDFAIQNPPFPATRCSQVPPTEHRLDVNGCRSLCGPLCVCATAAVSRRRTWWVHDRSPKFFNKPVSVSCVRAAYRLARCLPVTYVTQSISKRSLVRPPVLAAASISMESYDFISARVPGQHHQESAMTECNDRMTDPGKSGKPKTSETAQIKQNKKKSRSGQRAIISVRRERGRITSRSR